GSYSGWPATRRSAARQYASSSVPSCHDVVAITARSVAPIAARIRSPTAGNRRRPTTNGRVSARPASPPGSADPKDITWLRARRVDRADRQLDHPVRAADQRDDPSPRAEIAVHGENGPRAAAAVATDEHG